MDKIRIYPSDWTPKALGEVCDISIGGTPSRDQDRFWAQGEDGYPWVAISDMGPKLITKTNERITEGGVVNSNAKSVRIGTILMSFKLTLGRMGIAGIGLYTNEAIAAFVPKSKDVNSKWLYHFLPRLALSATAEQAIKGQTLNKKKLNRLKAYLPSPPEQRRIAKILDTIDEAIQKTEALISKLKAMKQGLLHDLLTRGLDKNGKLRDPKAHPEQFKDSPLGRIPKEWEVHEIGNCGNIITGTTPNTSRSTYYGGDIPFISPADLNNSRYVRSASGYLTDSGAAYARMLPEGTVLVSCIGILGKIGQLQHKATTNQQINAIIPNSMLEHSFTFWVAHLLKRQLDIVAGLQVVPIVNKTTFIRLLVPVPHVSEQIKGSSMLDAHDARIRAEEQYR
ncbi:MAG: restriction endonuclease subunit S, partial [Thermodesulfobacteriota bacterium]|nr:restriction endonuclease subunit S [Thermodesulfobacteriota bacterium]